MCRFDSGRPHQKQGPVDIHPIFSDAAAEAGYEIGLGVHLGGPRPNLQRTEQARIATWCAQHIAGLIPEETREEFSSPLAHLVAYFEDPRAGSVPLELTDAMTRVLNRRAPQEVLDAWADGSVPLPAPGPLIVLRLAIDATRYTTLNPRHVSSRARATARMTTGYLQGIATEDLTQRRERVGNFLEGLDARILHLEFQARCKHIAETPIKAKRVVYRGGDRGESIRILVAELDTGKHALLVRFEKWWKLFLGTPEEILPIVPDRFFEAASAACSQK